jgi:hypothetical protein
LTVHQAKTAVIGLAVALASVAAVRGFRPPRGRTPIAACNSVEARQFDFFVGDWDTYDVAAPTKVIARNRVTSILGDCVLHEVYEQTDGLVGESFSIFDASRGVWHQSWVTNRGALLLLDGVLVGNHLVLTGTERLGDGTSSLLRGTWYPEGDAVRETAERSLDGGKDWKPVFDIWFRPVRRDPVQFPGLPPLIRE